MKLKTVWILCFSLCFLLLWFVVLALNPEPHFKITKKGIEVEEIRLVENLSCMDNGCDGATVRKSELTLKWLDENCECYENNNENKQESSCDKYVCGEYLVEVWNQIK